MMIDVFCLSKNKRKLSVGEVCYNMEKLLCSSSSYRDLEGLVGKRIKHKWKDEDNKKWFYGTILDLVPGTMDWYNNKYDGEEDIISLNIQIDIEKRFRIFRLATKVWPICSVYNYVFFFDFLC